MRKTLLNALVSLAFLTVMAALLGMVILDFDRHHPVKPGTGFKLPR